MGRVVSARASRAVTDFAGRQVVPLTRAPNAISVVELALVGRVLRFDRVGVDDLAS